MAITVLQTLADLHEGLVLAPERYDPRRRVSTDRGELAGVVGDFFALIRETVTASSDVAAPVVVLDTSNAKEGVISDQKSPIAVSGLGSNKKVLAEGDIIISRLRPYLRQVAFVDVGLFEGKPRPLFVASTEFLVLRYQGDGSGAFLVPLLLSRRVQDALAAAQEGGHHPRFAEETLLQLPVPKVLWNKRAQISALVEQSISDLRKSERTMHRALRSVERLLANSATRQSQLGFHMSGKRQTLAN